MTTYSDEKARKKIVSEIDKNFFVEAGAGSGKTTMLVNRMVAMVEAGIGVEKINAITFTKAAANEFYERFQEKLAQRSNPQTWISSGKPGELPTPTEDTASKCREALKKIDLCFMGTIDAFCNKILSEHPSEAGIPSDSNVLSDEEVIDLYKQEFVKICNGDYDKENPKLKTLTECFNNLFGKKAQDAFVAGMKIFMENRNVHFNFSELYSVQLETKYAQEKKAIRKAINYMINNPSSMNETDKCRKSWDYLNKARMILSLNWDKNSDSVMFYLKKIKDASTILPPKGENEEYLLDGVVGVQGKGKKGVCNAGDGLVFRYDSLLQDMRFIKYEIALTFFEICVSILAKSMAERGKLSFFDYLFYLKEMLKNDVSKNGGKLTDYIYNRHSYFLLDEFQDTNPLQSEIFFYLTSQNHCENWFDCRPKPGSLFIVGDPKQSIYRFRGADVPSFLKVKGLFEKGVGEILPLTKNFRSTKGLCSYFNTVFSKMMKEQTETQSKFEQIPTDDMVDTSEKQFEGVYTYQCCLKEDFEKCSDKFEDDEIDSIRIREIIQRLVHNEKCQIFDKDNQLRNIEYGDIMVITKDKQNIGEILSELKKEKIPVRVEGKVLFKDNEALKQICKIYSAVAENTFCNIPLYEALLGKFSDLTDEKILKYKAEDGRIYFSGVEFNSTDTVAQDVYKQIEKLNELKRDSLKLSPAALFKKIIEYYKVYNVVETGELDVLFYTLELLRNAEKDGLIVTSQDAAVYLNKLKDDEVSEERCLLLTETNSCVHIANLHKVKGLEAPVVILAGKKPGRSKNIDCFIEHTDQKGEGYIVSIGHYGDKVQFGLNVADLKSDSCKKDYVDFEGKMALASANNDSEDQRLIYVAATRAKNILIVSNMHYLEKVRGKNEYSDKYGSAWQDLLSDKKNFFDEVPENETPFELKQDEVQSEKMYDDAENECVLKNKDVEQATFEVKKPSEIEIKCSGKIKKTDVVLGDDEKVCPEITDVVGDDIEETQTPKVEKSKIHNLPRELGTMVHKLMELIILSKGKLDSDLIIKKIVKDYLPSHKMDLQNDFEIALKNVAETVLKNGGYVQNNQAPQNIVKTLLEADEVHCEVPFTYKNESELWNGVMDVIYRKGDSWYIVDYKTNYENDDLDNHYKGQLEAYREAFKILMKVDIPEENAMIYHIDI